MTRKRWNPGFTTLVEVGILFLPGIPAYFWLWPNVHGLQEVWVQVAAYLYLLAGSLFIGRRRWDWGQLGFNRRGMGLTVICGMGLLIGRTMVIKATDWPGVLEPINFRRLVSEVAFYFGLVGLVEEYIFRGLIYQALDTWRSTRWAIWGSALAFGLFHIGWRSPLVGLGTLLYGAIFGAIRWRAGGIVGLIVVHGLIDITAVLMMPSLDLESIDGLYIAMPGLVGLGLVMILAVPLYLWKFYPILHGERQERI